MDNKQNESFNNLCDRSGGAACQSDVRPSRMMFRDAVATARTQIKLNIPGTYTPGEKRQAEGLAMIIAEIYMLARPSSAVTVGGELIDAYTAAEVFREINEDHVRMVIENFNNANSFIKNAKMYLRTALYNSVFEIEAHYVNMANMDVSGAGNGKA